MITKNDLENLYKIYNQLKNVIIAKSLTADDISDELLPEKHRFVYRKISELIDYIEENRDDNI